MRTPKARFRSKYRRKHRPRQVVSCTNVRHHDRVTSQRPHTRKYDQSARDALALAVIRAREAADYPSRPSFARAAKLGVTSMFKLESGVPVGPQVYEKVARALPGWTEDTPVRILEGAEPPATSQVTVQQQPEPGHRIDVTELLARLQRGGPEPTQDELRRLDLHGEEEAEILGMRTMSLSRKLAIILALRPPARHNDGREGRQTSA